MNYTFLCRFLLILFAIVSSIDSNDFEKDLMYQQAYDNYLKSHVQRGGLQSSSWPSDHGDISRSKYSLNAGIPKDFNPDDIKLKIKEDINDAQWIYTGGKNSEYLYLIAGRVNVDLRVIKLNSITLEELQSYKLPNSLYIGGMLIHANGHVYTTLGNKLISFWYGDLNNSTKVDIPNRNLNLIQTNGMLVTHDGHLVIKQWSAVAAEFLLLYLVKKKVIIKLLGACKTCSVSSVTIKAGLEENLKILLPEIKGVEAVQY